MSDEEKVVSMVRAVRKEFSRIDVLLNNASIASMNHILTTPYKSVNNIFNTNVFGTFLFTREVAKVMGNIYRKNYKNTKTMTFHIVNFSTIPTPLRLEGEAMQHLKLLWLI